MIKAKCADTNNTKIAELGGFLLIWKNITDP